MADLETKEEQVSTILDGTFDDVDAVQHGKWHKNNVVRSIMGGGMFDRG